MSVKGNIISLLREVENGRYSNIVLNEFFKNNHTPRKERSFITEIFYGVIRNKIFLDYEINKYCKNIKKDWIRNILRISIYQMTFMNSDAKGVIWEGTELTKKKFSVPVGRFVNGVLRTYQRQKDEDIKDLKEKNRFDILLSYPKWLYDKMQNLYKDKAIDVIKSMKNIPYISFRVNTLKYSKSEFEALLKEQCIDIIKNVGTVYYVNSGTLLYSQEFVDGKIIVQDGSSYLASKNLGAEPHEIVLDTCAAPGGKTLVLAEDMQNLGELLSLDIFPHKIKLIEENLKKAGVTIAKAIKMDARLLKEQGKTFDKILVDAPCSGYGVLRKKPEAIYNKKQENIENLAKLQLEILESAASVLKPSGTLVYSTCTILSEENTDNVRKFLEKHPDFKVQKLDIPENVSGTYDEFGGFTIDYHEDVLDGFYFIKFKLEK